MIPFVDLKTQYKNLKPEIDAAVLKALENAMFILGEEVALFEKEFASYCGASNGIGVNSGTSALHLALLAAGVKPGDEVITTPFTFIATVAAILYAGAKPVLVDINPKDFNIDVNLIGKAITKRTKAIIPVHLYGQPADMDPIMEIARKHKVVVIEDAAQAHAAEYKGRRAGSLGDMACFSFYPSKNLGAYGEGGMVVTNNPDYAKTVHILRDWGQESRYKYVLKGYNNRLEGIQGAILRVKLPYLDAWTQARRDNAALYNKMLAGLEIKTPEEMPYAKHVYHAYAVRSQKRDAIQKKLAEKEIQTAIHYPRPAHLEAAYSDLGYKPGDFPQAEKASSEVLSMPMFPELTVDQQTEITEAIKEALRSK